MADQNERQPVLKYRQPLVAVWYGALALVEAGVKRLGTADLFGGRLDTYRLETHHLAVFQHRRHVGIDPIMVAVLAAVLDDAHPRLPGLERGPHVLEYSRRYIRMTHRVVRRTHQLSLAVTTDVDEGIVAIGDGAACVGGGNQSLFGRKCPLMLSDGLVVAHGISILRSGRLWRGYRRARR